MTSKGKSHLRHTSSKKTLNLSKAEVLESVSRLPNVIDAFVAAKITKGKVTSKLGITIVVNEKLTHQELDEVDRIPSSIVAGSNKIRLDVLETKQLVHQAGYFFDNFPPLTNDGKEWGTLSALCVSQAGVNHGIFGLSCAHVLEGLDKNPYISSSIAFFSQKTNKWIKVGDTAYASVGPGTGILSNYGFSDAAIFLIDNPELISKASLAKQVLPARVKEGTRLHGYSYIQGPRVGTVIATEQSIFGQLVDVAISVENPGTFRGNSGMLWKDDQNRPVAIHVAGEQTPPGIGSSFTVAMWADRAINQCHVNFLDSFF